MHAWSTQVRLLVVLAAGTVCSLTADRGGSARGAGKGLNAPSAALLSLAPGAAEATTGPARSTTTKRGCAPAPTSSLVVNVRAVAYGAKGDGVTDDTAAIQRAVNAVAGTGGTVGVPDGTYMVNAVAQGSMGIRLGSNMTLRLSPGAVLKAIPNASANYAILAVSFANRVNIVGGTLLGERSAHTGSRGEWGMGLSISNSDQVVVDGVTAKECWGDGFYITDRSTNVTLCHVTADHNRRQGLSVTSVDGLVVRSSTFKNTAGTEPECGIDFEPNDGQTINNALVTGCTLANNAGSGFQCGFSETFTSPRITNTVFDSNTCAGNGLNPVSGGYRRGVYVDHSFGTVTVSNNTITGTRGQGILVSRSPNTIVKGNRVSGTLVVGGNTRNTGGGIYIWASPHSSITNNTVSGNATTGIWLMERDSTVVISGNTLSGNGQSS